MTDQNMKLDTTTNNLKTFHDLTQQSITINTLSAFQEIIEEDMTTDTTASTKHITTRLDRCNNGRLNITSNFWKGRRGQQ